MDNIKITILPDGTIKMETDKVSAPNHGNAEMLIREMVRLDGGASERKGKHGFTHTHLHEGIEHTH